MIVLDTNIVSEFMGSPPAPAVRAWLNGQDTTTLHITAVTVAEIKLGLRTMPAGKRRRLLDVQFERFHAQAFPSRVLPFDEGAADAYAEIRARRSRAGRPGTLVDAQIAAIARSVGMAVATRNVKDFEECGVVLINPFDFRVAS